MKRIKALWGLTATLLVAGVLILGACFNPLAPPAIGEEGGSGSLTITVGGTPDLVRTLYPRAEFTRYVLSFTPNDGQPPYADVPLIGQSTKVITDLPLGSWDISAKGFVTIEGQDYEAASQTQRVEVTGETQIIDFSITAKPIDSGGRGYFSYSVDFPAAKVDYAVLTFTHPSDPDGWPPVQTNPATGLAENITSIDLKVEGTTDTIPLAPGYYLVRVQLRNPIQAAGRTEVVHIYPNLETKGEFVFHDEDFVDLITLSGNADIQLDNAPLTLTSWVELGAYILEPLPGAGAGTDVGYGQQGPTGQQIAGTNLDLSGNWSLVIPSFDTPTEVYFWIRTYYNNTSYSWNIGHQVVGNTSLSGLNFSSHKSTITLSGTVDVTVGQDPPSSIQITAFADSTYKVQLGSASVEPQSASTAWSITMLALDEQTEVYFDLAIQEENLSIPQQTGVHRSVYNTDVSNIALGPYSFNVITLSGTVDTVTVNGDVPDRIDVLAYTEPDNENQYAMWVTTGVEEDGTWSMLIEPFAAPTEVSFSLAISGQKSGNYYSTRQETGEKRTVHNQSIGGINLGPFELEKITLSGTVDATFFGLPPNFITVEAFHVVSDGYVSGYYYTLGSASVDMASGTWSMLIDPLDAPTDVYFRLYISTPDGGGISQETGVQVIVHDEDTDDIDLGTFDLEKITLHGIVNVTINGAASDYISVTAYDNADCTGTPLGSGSSSKSVSGTTWHMQIDPFNTPTDVYFELYIQPQGQGGSFSYQIEEPVSVYNQGKSIDLGTFDLEKITLSGTVNITLNGAAPSYIWVDVYGNANHTSYLGYASVNINSGTWSVQIDPFDTPTDVYFNLYIEPQGGRDSFSYTIEEPVSVYNQDMSGINLGTFNLISISGSAAIQKDGVAVQEGRVVAFGVTGSQRTFLGDGDYNGSDWSIYLAPYSGTVSFVVQAITSNDYMILYELDATKNTTLSGSGRTGINLGTVNIPTKNITVSITQGGTPVDANAYVVRIAALNRDDYLSESFMYEMVIAGANGFDYWSSTETIPVPQSTPDSVGFGVMVRVAGGVNLYVTRSAVNISSGLVSLDINNMDFWAFMPVDF
jgi:hypothetical protein